MIAVMAAFAEGTTIIRDAAELKVKETDRIKTTTEGLLAMGVDVTPTDDGMIIRGGNPVHGGQINSYLDHRIAMAFSIAALAAEGNTEIQDGQCVDAVSYTHLLRPSSLLMHSALRTSESFITVNLKKAYSASNSMTASPVRRQ